MPVRAKAVNTMVEKKSYQAHHRNISGLSEISITLDPIKREDGDEIKVVFLLDSWTERNSLFDLIHRYLQDGQSDIAEPALLNHHWEQPHRDCQGVECVHCIKISHHQMSGPGVKGHDRRASEDNTLSSIVTQYREQNKLKSRHDSFGSSLAPGNNEGYFRFFIDGCPFRLMLLSKDKQNLLKIVTFDFLVVCMQVQRKPGETDTSLDENIWEFEWKRLEKHSKKILAPVILLGYFRDILKLGQIGHGDSLPLEKIILDSKLSLQRTCRKYHAIPRFCDFVTGSSQELYNLFFDLRKLFQETGYILQQCALANNIQHFKMVMESVSYKEEDLLYTDPETGDNPVMIAAKLRHKDLVSDVLRSPRFSRNDDSEFLESFIHSRNKYGQTLLHMVAIQGPELEEQKLLILRKEIEIHCLSELTHEADQLQLQRCLRSQLKSSAESAIINEQCRALQGIPKTPRELKAEKGKVWSRLFFSTLFLSLIFNAIDTGSDILIMIRYFNELMGDQSTSANTCNTDFQSEEQSNNTTLSCNRTTWDMGQDFTIKCFPLTMDPQSKFGYTLFFILVPWPFFIYEYFTSRHYENMKNKFKEIIDEMSQCNGLKSIITCYLKLILHTITFVSCVAFWPIAVLFIKYYEDGKYYLSKGAKKVDREKKIETSEVLYSTARVMEVSLESSFQPTIQLYLLFPTLVQQVEGDKFVFQVFTVCKAGTIPVIKPDQTISIITSILSLSWCFTAYHATLKRGALDKDLAALFYRAVLFLSVLFQILGRLFILVFFAYSFGPGRYFPMLIFLGSHILLMSFLHFIFSDAKKYWQKGGFLNLSFFHYLIGNGLANIYIHNWIRMDPLLLPWSKPLQHVSTLVRQFLFDLIFIMENVVLLGIALNSNIIELKESRVTYWIVLMGFQLVGLILKCVYYRYLHLWAWLIMDYTTLKEDGHWKCILFSNMFLCGELRQRKLLLCCIPRPCFKILAFFFGERKLGSGGSCSICGALFSCLLFPLALALALVALVAVLIIAILFMPVFIVFYLPCLVYAKCRTERAHHQIVKITESESKPDNFLLVEADRISMGDMKPDTNCTNL